MKKGFTLIEILISISLISLLLITELKVLEKYLILYNFESVESRKEFYSNEVVEFIDEKISQSKSISCENNKIKFSYLDSMSSDWIKLNTTALYLGIYYGSENSSNNNVILRGVKDFKVESVNKVIYLTIIMENNYEVNRCIATEKIQ